MSHDVFSLGGTVHQNFFTVPENMTKVWTYGEILKYSSIT